MEITSDNEMKLDVFGDAICWECERNIHWFMPNAIIKGKYYCEDCGNKLLRSDDEIQKGTS